MSSNRITKFAVAAAFLLAGAGGAAQAQMPGNGVAVSGAAETAGEKMAIIGLLSSYGCRDAALCRRRGVYAAQQPFGGWRRCGTAGV
jgi:hypothetical protein